IPAKFRNSGWIRKIPRIHGAVAQEFVQRAMQRVRTRFSHGVHNRAVAAELSAVRIGQRLELADGFDSERCAGDRAKTAIVKGLEILVVHQERSSLRPAS